MISFVDRAKDAGGTQGSMIIVERYTFRRTVICKISKEKLQRTLMKKFRPVLSKDIEEKGKIT
jgi:hypothetical protein